MSVFTKFGIATLAAIVCLAQSASAKDLTFGALATGTVRWELDTIPHFGIDEANGFSVKVPESAGNPATQVALAGGEVDAIMSDWLWVAQQRAEGRAHVFIPFMNRRFAGRSVIVP